MAFSEVLALFHFIALASCVIFLTQDLEFGSVNIYSVGSPRYDWIPVVFLAWFRAACAAVIWCSLAFITLQKKPLEIMVMLPDGNKKMVSLIHFERFSMFTVWSWLLKGVYFTLASYCSFSVNLSNSATASNIVVYAAWILFEIAFPVAFIVSSIVTFVLIPYAKKNQMPTFNFFTLLPVLMHNANIFFMALEIIMNKLPFAMWHFPFILFYGMAYVVFSWGWHYYHGYYFYYFLDYNRKEAIYWYVGLMIMVALFFFIGYWTSFLMNSFQSVLPSLLVVLITATVIKLDD